jgi:hypothetical protein
MIDCSERTCRERIDTGGELQDFIAQVRLLCDRPEQVPVEVSAGSRLD